MNYQLEYACGKYGETLYDYVEADSDSEAVENPAFVGSGITTILVPNNKGLIYHSGRAIHGDY